MNRSRKKFLSTLLSLLLVLPMLATVFAFALTAAGQENDLQVTLAWLVPVGGTGSTHERTNNNKVLNFTPGNNSTANTTLRVTLAPAAMKTFQPGEVEFRVPIDVYFTRAGAATGSYTLDVPTAPKAGEIFHYTYDAVNRELVFTNDESFSTGHDYVFDISYTFVPSNVEDGYTNPNVAPRFRLKEGGAFPPTYTGVNPDKVTINT